MSVLSEPALKLYFLGAPRIECDGEVLSTDTRKATALLARLALSGERLSRDLLAAFLWPDSDEQRAKAALRRTLSDLKKSVGDDALFISRETLGADEDAFWCDVPAFLAAVQTVQEHEHEHSGAPCPTCRPALEQAAELYRDEFLAGFYLRDSGPFDDWRLQQSEYLRREFALVLEQLVAAKVAEGDFAAAIPDAQRWLALDPLHEAAHRRLMQLYAWTGQRNEALRQYRDCVRILDEELGVPPLEETTELYRAIQEERLPPPQPALPAAAAAPEADADEPLTAQIPFLGRDAELAQMAAMYEQVGPNGRFLVLSGEAGIGKTSLAETFLAGLTLSAQLRGRCYPGETHMTYAPFVQAMRDGLRREDAAERLARVPPAALAEAARLLPELEQLFRDLPPAPPLDWPGAQGRFFAGLGDVLAALLAGPRPGVLWLDDVQWADSASLELLAYLVRRRQELPALILVCWRSGDLSPDSLLPQLLAEARRERGGAMLPLSRLPAAVVQNLLGAVAGSDASGDDGLGARLYAETEGLPFLISAYLQALPGESRAGDAAWSMPATVRDLFQARLARVDEMERQILQTAAVIGRACRFEMLKTVSGRSEEEAITAVEAALAHLLLVEQDPDQDFDFSHHKLRDLVLEEMSLARRRLLHRRVARALSFRHGSAPGALTEDAARIAAHYQQAGLDERAADYYVRAGHYAVSLFALREALAHFETALALGYANPAQLHEICGELSMRLGEYSAALNSLERAAVLGDAARQATAEHKLGQVYYRLGEWASADYHFAQAQAAAREGAPAEAQARLLIDWSATAYRRGEIGRSRELVQQAQALSTSGPVRAQVHNSLGLLAREEGDPAAAIEQFALGYELAQTVHELGLEITAANNLALAKTAVGSYDEALPLFEEALQKCRRYGDRHWEAAIRNNLADLYHARGQETEAMQELKASITILAEIGREAGDWQPEIWKLSAW